MDKLVTFVGCQYCITVVPLSCMPALADMLHGLFLLVPMADRPPGTARKQGGGKMGRGGEILSHLPAESLDASSQVCLFGAVVLDSLCSHALSPAKCESPCAMPRQSEHRLACRLPVERDLLANFQPQLLRIQLTLPGGSGNPPFASPGPLPRVRSRQPGARCDAPVDQVKPPSCPWEGGIGSSRVSPRYRPKPKPR